ncbi:trihelix transcription factor GTL2 [Silene latifolia]|uniref:trihelix transcription factor GTL2 n=1 Tax=Silene latifolia TaxID=37657 RepID=UPI003D76D924
MFDEMPDQFYQFLAATSRTTNNIITTTSTTTPTNITSIPLSFSLHHPNFPQQQQQQQAQQASFDASYFIQQQQQQQARLSQPVAPWSTEEVLALLKIRSAMDNPWFPAEFTWDNVSRKLEEVGFKRSAESCKEKFEEETRSFNNIVINNCSSNNNNKNNNNVISQNYRLFGELEELYSNTTTTTNGDKGNNINDHNHEQNSADQLNECADVSNENENDQGGEIQENVEKMGEENSGNVETGVRDEDEDGLEEEEEDGHSVGDDSEKTEENSKEGRKRKRRKKFEMFKGFCEKIVNKMMAKQEEFHCKILQDMVKRDEDKSSREEAWKKQEIDRITKELEVRAHEQAIVGDREAKILGFLKKFSSSSSTTTNNLSGNVRIKVPNTTTTTTTTTTLSTSSIYLSQDSISETTHDQNSISNLVIQQKCNLLSAPQSLDRMENQKLSLPMLSSSMNQCSKNPNPGINSSENDLSTRVTSISTTTHKSFASNHTSTDATGQVTDSKHENVVKDDTGRRWPRDEVLALINIRCSLFNNNGDHLHDKESLSKGPLWERISQKMMELGYMRSSKRCKEKWENINKYFRKTKDLNKKRSIDSRTCPYFHQLSHLYNQGAPLHGQSDRSVSLVDSPDNQSMALSGAQGGSST